MISDIVGAENIIKKIENIRKKIKKVKAQVKETIFPHGFPGNSFSKQRCVFLSVNTKRYYSTGIFY